MDNESLKTDTMKKYWAKRLDISQCLLSYFGLSSLQFRIAKWLCYGNFVDHVNNAYKMNVKPSGIAYWIPFRIQWIILILLKKVIKIRGKKKIPILIT